MCTFSKLLMPLFVFKTFSLHYCLVLLQVSKCFVPAQFFWASPKIWLYLVPLQKLLCRHKKQFYWMQIIFLSGTKCLWLPQYVNKFLVWHKKFGPAQNILGPVKGQGIRYMPGLQHIVIHITEIYRKQFVRNIFTALLFIKHFQSPIPVY